MSLGAPPFLVRVLDEHGVRAEETRVREPRPVGAEEDVGAADLSARPAATRVAPTKRYSQLAQSLPMLW